MDSIVIGTAGHIDHGKTALVKALTGKNTDTLEEEQRRGITINLGFAYFTLPCGKVAGIVDVPGHERFVRNMLAGASGIDIAVVVVAANEGVMPQTREHIDILSYMKIQKSLVVLTKTDMVDADFLELVREDTREYLQGTFLQDAPVLEVDSLSGRGIEALVSTLDTLAGQVQKRNLNKDLRMSVDRVFTVKGFGTVVTGTLADGVVHVDDEVTLYPGNLTAKVRSLQIHEQDVPEARVGQRTAMNLAGITKEQVARGSMVLQKGAVRATGVLDVYLSLSANARVKIKKMDMVKMYIGAREMVVRVVLLGTKQIAPGERAYAQLLLDKDAVVRKNDVFVLRTISPVETIGGGHVVDPAAARYKRVDDALLKAVQAKDTDALGDVLETFVKAHPFEDTAALAKLVDAESIDEALAECTAEGRILCLEGRYLHPEHVQEMQREVAGILQEYHERFPLRAGMAKAELESRQGVAADPRHFELLLGWLAQQGCVALPEGSVALAGFQPAFSPKHQRLRAEMEAQVDAAGYTLLTLNEVVGRDPGKKQVLEALQPEAFQVLDGQYVIKTPMLEQAKAYVRQLAGQEGSIKLAGFRDMLATSRKYALLLLEKFDREKLTKRDGEDRVLL